jgi:thioredoxin reductase
MDFDHEVIVSGGGAAGLSAGIALARSGTGTAVEVDPMGQTSVPGVYAAGNVTDLGAQVMGAAAAGTKAGAAVNADLVMADAREKVSA